MDWAGTEPIDRDAHDGCECEQCCPTCAVPGCHSYDVTARSVPVDATWRWTVRVLLCDLHGRSRPVWHGDVSPAANRSARISHPAGSARRERAVVCPACGDDRCLIHCVWCLVDCDTYQPRHLPHCPQLTGLYPAPDGACCVVCGDPMAVYVSRVDAVHDVELAVCVSCAATNRPEEP